MIDNHFPIQSFWKNIVSSCFYKLLNHFLFYFCGFLIMLPKKLCSFTISRTFVRNALLLAAHLSFIPSRLHAFHALLNLIRPFCTLCLYTCTILHTWHAIRDNAIEGNALIFATRHQFCWTTFWTISDLFKPFITFASYLTRKKIICL